MGVAASLMSRRHTWLRFAAVGDPLPLALTGAGIAAGALGWQHALTELHRRWYAGTGPPQVAAVFVLQWVLQVVAHTTAYAATTGPWRASPDGLTVALGPALVPEVVRLTQVVPDPGSLEPRLARAEADYRRVAEPLSRDYPAQTRIGPHARAALVDDMWVAAAREARAAAGIVEYEVPARDSCCLIYALPGCVECAGCPRVRRA